MMAIKSESLLFRWQTISRKRTEHQENQNCFLSALCGLRFGGKIVLPRTFAQPVLGQ
jgi:hypothetical protein